MPEVRTDDAVLHVEIDGEGEPVTVLAHGLTNSSQELAAFTPLVAGTKVRFDFRGHGRSSVPETGYGFADFARDLDAVANAYGARNAVGTSLGAGAICHLLGEDPARFERIVLLLPAALDVVVGGEGFLRTASILESMPLDEAIDTLLSEPGRAAKYAEAPWLRELDLLMWKDLNAAGVAKALRGIVGDVAIRDRELPAQGRRAGADHRPRGRPDPSGRGLARARRPLPERRDDPAVRRGGAGRLDPDAGRPRRLVPHGRRMSGREARRRRAGR